MRHTLDYSRRLPQEKEGEQQRRGYAVDAEAREVVRAHVAQEPFDGSEGDDE